MEKNCSSVKCKSKLDYYKCGYFEPSESTSFNTATSQKSNQRACGNRREIKETSTAKLCQSLFVLQTIYEKVTKLRNDHGNSVNKTLLFMKQTQTK